MRPSVLKAGDEIRVIAPSRSLAIVKGDQRSLAEERLKNMGFKVTYGKTAFQHDDFFSNPIEARINDLHDAFEDQAVKGILTAVGGYNSNQLLRYIDFELIEDNPKVWMGYSDITALSLAIYKKTGLYTYSGPFFSTFGMKAGHEYTVEYFKKAVMRDEVFELAESETWSEDSWHLESKNRTLHPNDGYQILQEGDGEGTIIAGNLSTIHLLQGTDYMPSLKDSILFLEEVEESHPFNFDRLLQSLLHLQDAAGIKGIVLGRFQKETGMTPFALSEIISSKRELAGIPVIADANFGHVHPFATIPVGGKAKMSAVNGRASVFIQQ
ncbi:S66 peptidase family protein [Bacillus massiliglaciei]|uniref:S66 peptidase family protein n=1 Tax=Bacillus massiliglaciei TaxID=1816693 RepID=UPI000DA5EEA8|nr:S66 peptidase family protein [Bacillus massiliglaciei]